MGLIDVQVGLSGGVPEDGVGDQVAEVGLLGAVAGVALAVQVHLGGGEHGAVLGLDLSLDLGGALGDGGVGALVGGEVNRGDGDGAVLDGDDAGGGGGGAGGGHQGVAHLAGAAGGGLHVVKGAVAVAVDEHIDAGDLGEQVDGAVGGALIVDAQVAQADDVIAAGGLKSGDLLLGAADERAVGEEGHALDHGGVGLGGGLRGGEAKDADGLAAQLIGGAGGELGAAVVEHVGGQDVELGGLHHGDEVRVAVVELVVAQGGDVIAGEVHELDGGGALAGADLDGALAEVAGVHQQDGGALGLVLGLQGGYLGVAVDGAVDVIGVDDDDLAGGLGGGLLGRGLFLGGSFFLSLFAFSRGLLALGRSLGGRVAGLFGGLGRVRRLGVGRIGRAAQGEDHSQHEQQAQQLFACLHVYPPSCSPLCRDT